jgi:hypothetical protein
MQTFKAKIEKNTEYKVTAEDFKIACKVNRELVQDKSFYGICPHCDGPVQLIGLYKKKETETKPYARHTFSDIEGVAKRTIATDYCPLNTHRKEYNPEAHFVTETRHSVSMFKAIIEYWNEIIFIIRQEYGIYISEEREKEILNTIKLSEVWLYPCADIRNLPWVILNRMPPEELYFKWIRKDSELYNVLVNKGIKLEKKNNNYYQIIKQDFYFNWNYRYDGFAQKAVDDEIVDSIEECIIEETKDDTGYIEHYASTKVINRNRFYNLIHSEKALSNPRRKEKQELAAEILGEPPIPNE